jgi:hypothetical protein
VPAGKKITVPSIPVAFDLPSAIAALNAIRQFLFSLTNQTSAVGGGGGPLAAGQFPNLFVGNLVGGFGGQTPRGQQSRFRMVQDVQVPVKLTSEDGSVTVDLTQTNRLVLVNDVTNETWIFQRPGT